MTRGPAAAFLAPALAAAGGLGGGPARAQSYTPAPSVNAHAQAPEPKRNAWSFGLTGLRHELKSGRDDELLGNSAAVQIGSAYIADFWYADVSLDILLGPYEPARAKQLDVDYVGTGATAWLGFSAQTLNLRSAEGGYGFALGLNYADIVGRSVGRNRNDNGLSTGNAGLIEDYTMRVTELSILPAIFFSWLTESRPRGNTPELLTTRVEGYIFTIGAAMPFLANYSSKYTVRGDGSDANPDYAKNEHGKLRGYSLLVTLKAMLGT